jgi:hypothetical protein
MKLTGVELEEVLQEYLGIGVDDFEDDEFIAGSRPTKVVAPRLKGSRGFEDEESFMPSKIVQREVGRILYGKGLSRQQRIERLEGSRASLITKTRWAWAPDGTDAVNAAVKEVNEYIDKSIRFVRSRQFKNSFEGENTQEEFETTPIWNAFAGADEITVSDLFEEAIEENYSPEEILDIYEEEFSSIDSEMFESFYGKSRTIKIKLGKKRLNKFCTTTLMNADKRIKAEIAEKIRTAPANQRTTIFKLDYLPRLKNIINGLPKKRNRCKRVIINQITAEQK